MTVGFYNVSPIDPGRRAIWLETLGRESLPISQPSPTYTASGLSYQIDGRRLDGVERSRLAGAMVERSGTTYHQALKLIEDGLLTIPAVDLAIVLDRNYAQEAALLAARTS